MEDVGKQYRGNINEHHQAHHPSSIASSCWEPNPAVGRQRWTGWWWIIADMFVLPEFVSRFPFMFASHCITVFFSVILPWFSSHSFSRHIVHRLRPVGLSLRAKSGSDIYFCHFFNWWIMVSYAKMSIVNIILNFVRVIWPTTWQPSWICRPTYIFSNFYRNFVGVLYWSI